LVEILQAAGPRPVFGIPGGQTFPFYAAARAHGIPHILMRDERNCVSAADAYARLTGSVGVCDATVGPGATNLVSGLAEAYAAGVSVLAIIADIRTDREHLRHRGVVSQAMDQAEMLAPVCKWLGRVQSPRSIDDMVAHALRVATTGRAGPVVLEIPEDVFAATITERKLDFSAADFAFPRYRSAPTAAALDQAAATLSAAHRPVILVGGGVVLSGAAQSVARFSAEFGIPVVTSINGKGVVDESSPLAGGVVGVFGTVRASLALRSADTVLVLGSKLDQSTTHRFRLPERSQRVIQVDTDGEELGRAMPVEVAVLADVREFIDALSGAVRGRMSNELGWLESVRPSAQLEGTDDGAVAPDQVAAVIGASLREQDVVVCDASLSSAWGSANIELTAPGQRFLAPRGLAGLGWSCGAAIGARLAMPADGRLTVLAGDGGWAYGVAEVETAVRMDLPITYVILNNSGLGWVVQGEKDAGISPPSVFGQIDFAAAGIAMGAHGVVAHTLAEFETLLEQARRSDRATVIDVRSSLSASPIIAYSAVRKLPLPD
jgi:acetolactate synthase-1/2/3 large subunit